MVFSTTMFLDVLDWCLCWSSLGFAFGLCFRRKPLPHLKRRKLGHALRQGSQHLAAKHVHSVVRHSYTKEIHIYALHLHDAHRGIVVAHLQRLHNPDLSVGDNEFCVLLRP